MKMIILFGSVLLAVFYMLMSLAGKPGRGEEIFSKNCAACHTIGTGDLAGPDLKGVTERRAEEWLLKFIKSPRKLIKSKDQTALDLYNKYNQIVMPDQKLTDDEIKEVLEYINLKGME